MKVVSHGVPVLTEDEVNDWAADLTAYAATYGLQMADHMAPCTLQPMPIPKFEFERAIALAPVFNQLCDRIEHHPTFMKEALSNVAKVDPFTQKLLEIYNIVQSEGISQKFSMYIDRSDYMMHNGSLKHVELNTISSAFAALSSRISRLHGLMMGKTAIQADLPMNAADVNIAKVVAKGLQQFDQPGAVVLMIVQPNERNSIDQRAIEVILWEQYRIQTIRRTLAQISASSRMDGTTLFIDGTHRVGVAYFRAGYSPMDYHGDQEWQARIIIERSSAIKCPTIAHHQHTAGRLCAFPVILNCSCPISPTYRDRYEQYSPSNGRLMIASFDDRC